MWQLIIFKCLFVVVFLREFETPLCNEAEIRFKQIGNWKDEWRSVT